MTHLLPLISLIGGNDSRIFHKTPFYAVKLIPVAIWRIFSWVASPRESSPTLSPSCMTMIRSLIPRTSGNSDEIIMIALPGTNKFGHQTVDFRFGADINPTRWLVQDQEIRLGQ